MWQPNKLEQERLEKVRALEAQGIDPFPARVQRRAGADDESAVAHVDMRRQRDQRRDRSAACEGAGRRQRGEEAEDGGKRGASPSGRAASCDLAAGSVQSSGTTSTACVARCAPRVLSTPAIGEMSS